MQEKIQGQTDTVVEGYKWRETKSARKLHTLGVGFPPFIELGVGIVITWGMDFLEVGFLTFSFVFGLRFPVMIPAILGLPGLIQLLVECYQDRPQTFLIAGHSFLYAAL